jgi:glycosyltransferase involved in cell wall biosynthesis
MHDVYGPGGGVLTVVRHLAGELAAHHDVEIVSVMRTGDEPVHRMPDGVVLTTLADTRPMRFPWLPHNRRRARLSAQPSEVIPRSEPRYRKYNAYTDRKLVRYLESLEGGAVIGMQPGVSVAIAKHAPDSVVRVAQDHVPFRLRPQELHEDMRLHFDRLDQFLTLTSTDAKRYRRFFRHQIPVRRLPNAAPDYHGPLSDHTTKVVTAAGRLERLKGFDRLVDAWALVHAKHPDWELRIFGAGSQAGPLREQVQRLGLDEVVRLHGYSRNLHAELAGSSIFAMGSRFEAFGMVLVEAMSCGVPAVAFDCPTGPRDIIEDGVNGFLVRNRDIEGLAGRVIELIEDHEARAEMGRHAHESAHARNQTETAREWQRMLRRLRRKKQRQAG